MKELTIEEKAKAYDEAIERASKLRVQNPFDTVSQMMEHIFPELKESEDERIRKALINGFKDYKGWDEECYDIAKKYKTYADFLRYDSPAYNSSMRNDWLKNFLWLEHGKHEYKYILQITKEGKILNKFNSPKEASEKLNLNIGNIYYSCRKLSLIKGTNFYFKGEK